MPTFIDWHDADRIPDDLKRTLQGRIKQGQPDEHGVIDRGVVLDRDAGKMYCILEAPNEEAIRRHHQAAGVPLETIHRADAVL